MVDLILDGPSKSGTPEEKTMSRYRFAPIPTLSSVAAAVTLIVSGWLTVAGATMVAQPSNPFTGWHAMAGALERMPDVRETIHVTASRSAALPEMRETIVVTASRALPEVRETITVTASRLEALPEAQETIAVSVPRVGPSAT